MIPRRPWSAQEIGIVRGVKDAREAMRALSVAGFWRSLNSVKRRQGIEATKGMDGVSPCSPSAPGSWCDDCVRYQTKMKNPKVLPARKKRIVLIDASSLGYETHCPMKKKAALQQVAA